MGQQKPAETGRQNQEYSLRMRHVADRRREHPLPVRFYLVAMLFILFDIEVVFLYPWAVVYREMLKENANLIFGAMVSFLGVLFVGYIYALKKQAFDWKS